MRRSESSTSKAGKAASIALTNTYRPQVSVANVSEGTSRYMPEQTRLGQVYPSRQPRITLVIQFPAFRITSGLPVIRPEYRQQASAMRRMERSMSETAITR